MSALDMSLVDLIGALLGFVLTISIFSYIWGDNALFRIAAHLFIGVTAGYVAVVVIHDIILPQMVFPFVEGFMEGERGAMVFAILFLILGALMLTKISPRLTKLGNPAVAYLVGVGAATAIGGAVVGTLFPQTSASINVFSGNNFFDGLVILVGTLTTLLYFQFVIGRKREDEPPDQRPRGLEVVSGVGQIFIAVTFGALFTGVYLAAITALIERVSFIWDLIRSLMPGLLS
jgi:hypothetical protein